MFDVFIIILQQKIMSLNKVGHTWMINLLQNVKNKIKRVKILRIRVFIYKLNLFLTT